MAEERSLARSAGLLAASQYGTAAIGFVTTVVAGRLLGPAGYGTAMLVVAYPTLLWSFAGFKPVTVVTPYLEAFRGTGKRVELASTCRLAYGLDLLSSAAVFFSRWRRAGGWRHGFTTPRTSIG